MNVRPIEPTKRATFGLTKYVLNPLRLLCTVWEARGSYKHQVGSSKPTLEGPPEAPFWRF